jgi:cell division protein FtsI/penicillin-binding protein 2
LLICAFVLLAVRCFYLQKFRSADFNASSLHQQLTFIPQRPQRGPVLDRRGRLLAASNEIRTIKAEPRRITDVKEVANMLASVVNIPAHEISPLIRESSNPGYAKILAEASAEQAAAARRIPGIGVDTTWRRYYPTGRLCAHILGFTSNDVECQGLSGLELQYDEQLTGSPGENIYFADIFRRPVKIDQLKGPRNGTGIILTIDSTIQQFVRTELMKQYKEYQAESATAIVADPKTGEILAMVSLPDFDPGDRTDISQDWLRNRALTDQFEPGSIIKPVVAAIALDAGAISKTEKIFCENGSYYGRGFGRIGEYRRGFGNLNIKEILINSSNIGMAKVGQKLGKEKLHAGMKRFGFGSKTGIDLPGEVSGVLWPVKAWTGYSVTRVPYGQEITVTSLQMVRAFCMLANGGRSVRPSLVKATVDNETGKVTVKEHGMPIGFVVEPQVAKWIVNEALVGVINDGTGERAKLEKWQVFGKTGTANIAKANERGYSDSDYVASFVAGAPADDPQIVVLVSIRKPNKSLGKGYTGGVVASPVAAKIIEQTLTYLEKNPL